MGGMMKTKRRARRAAENAENAKTEFLLYFSGSAAPPRTPRFRIFRFETTKPPNCITLCCDYTSQRPESHRVAPESSASNLKTPPAYRTMNCPDPRGAERESLAELKRTELS